MEYVNFLLTLATLFFAYALLLRIRFVSHMTPRILDLQSQLLDRGISFVGDEKYARYSFGPTSAPATGGGASFSTYQGLYHTTGVDGLKATCRHYRPAVYSPDFETAATGTVFMQDVAMDLRTAGLLAKYLDLVFVHVYHGGGIVGWLRTR